ncbi:MAG: ABC transporter permease [Bacteroidales bacterium]|nr:ABC transporter permease [Bacteroidales bacterium]
MKSINLIIENLRIAISAISSNRLRTVLTILIIAIGIMALVGILTAVDSIKNTISSEFVGMGANTFSILKKRTYVQGQETNKRKTAIKNISFEDARNFKKNYDFPAWVSVSVDGTWGATVKYKSEKTNPNIYVMGVDEDYMQTSGYEILHGRNFIENEIISGNNVVILGNDIVKSVFSKNENPIDKYVSIGNAKYRVIGVLKPKGTSFGGDGDKFCMLPLNNARQTFPSSSFSYEINIKPYEPELLASAISEAEGVFRSVRKLTVYDENDFRISKSDNMANMLIDNISVVTIGATIIGLITLLGATIGLMNIMLVSVSERTREIGIRKAIGAKPSTIKQQFLLESIFIGQLGGVLGIVLGIIAGNFVSFATKAPFYVPWLWIILGVVLCFLVGIISGYFPAVKASKLDPIIALHYE